MKNLIVLTVLLVWMPAIRAAESDTPNVLFIAVDDLRCELGCYGVKELKSPNIDRLAKRGVVFDFAYCQQAVCNPSRVSLLTGLRSDSTRVWDLVTDFRTTIPNAVTIPQHFRKNQYRALSYGKIFHNVFPDNVSWDEPHRWPENSQLWSGDAKRRKELRDRLDLELRKTGDPRCATDGVLNSTPPTAPSSPSSAQWWKVQAPPPELKAPPFYKKYVDAGGYPILASERVNDHALKEAAFLVTKLLTHRPDVKRAMVASGSRLVILAHDEFTTDLPEFSHFEPKDYWDARARGTGGSLTDPNCSRGEENLLGYPGDPYPTENILIHEFAHNIHLRGMVNIDPTFDERAEKTYERAMAKGQWRGKYASVNHHEYFAEGVQSWFNNNRENDHDHNHVNTRRELIDYDPGLAALCREVFGDTELVYTKPTTRLDGHLAGYDPSQSPQFVWPKRLDAVRAQIRADAKKRERRHDADLDHEQSPVTNDSDSSKP